MRDENIQVAVDAGPGGAVVRDEIRNDQKTEAPAAIHEFHAYVFRR